MHHIGPSLSGRSQTFHVSVTHPLYLAADLLACTVDKVIYTLPFSALYDFFQGLL